jgi:AcrR family transcriptional regulator
MIQSLSCIIVAVKSQSKAAKPPAMPRVKQKQEKRRKEVSDAAWRVILREGLDRTSVRAIAQELGCTTGVVMHYFRTKDELMLFALDRVLARSTSQLSSSIESYEGLGRLERLLTESLPRDAKSEIGWKIWLAFLGHAVGHPRLMVEHRNRYAQLRDFIIRELKELRSRNFLRSDVNLRLEASALIALIDGLSIGMVIDRSQIDVKGALRLIRRYIEQLSAAPEAFDASARRTLPSHREPLSKQTTV